MGGFVTWPANMSAVILGGRFFVHIQLHIWRIIERAKISIIL